MKNVEIFIHVRPVLQLDKIIYLVTISIPIFLRGIFDMAFVKCKLY